MSIYILQANMSNNKRPHWRGTDVFTDLESAQADTQQYERSDIRWVPANVSRTVHHTWYGFVDNTVEPLYRIVERSVIGEFPVQDTLNALLPIIEEAVTALGNQQDGSIEHECARDLADAITMFTSNRWLMEKLVEAVEVK